MANKQKKKNKNEKKNVITHFPDDVSRKKISSEKSSSVKASNKNKKNKAKQSQKSNQAKASKANTTRSSKKVKKIKIATKIEIEKATNNSNGSVHVKIHPSKTQAKTPEQHQKTTSDITYPTEAHRRKPIRRKIVLAVLLRVLIIAAAAIGITWFLEYKYFMNDADKVMNFINNHTLIWWWNCLIVFCVTMIVASIFRSAFLGVGLTFIMAIILGFVEVSKFAYRGSPFVPEDLQLAGETGTLTKFVSIESIVGILVAIGLVVILINILDYLTRGVLLWKKKDAPKKWTTRSLLYPRIAMATIGIVGLAFSAGFIVDHGSKMYESIDWLDTEFISWNQVENYDQNGFIVGFLYNLGKLDLEEPAGYDKEAIEKIAAEYNEDYKKASSTSVSLSDSDYNIVIVLGESFYDMSFIREYGPYDYEGDITPRIHSIMDQYPSGWMYSPEYGGGTANIEFEVFTGLTNYWINTIPYTHLLPKISNVPSIISYAKENGYQSVAIHPFKGGMYRRNVVLFNEGFDEFITEKEMHHTEHDGDSEYINDDSAYKEVLDIIKDRPQKQIIGVITMQNHSPYEGKNYPDSEIGISNFDDYQEEKEIVSNYLKTVHSSDAYLGDFIDTLSEMDEKTVVLFFGDHAPGVLWSPIADDREEALNATHLTPYFIYANFDLPGNKSTKEETDKNKKNDILRPYYYYYPYYMYYEEDEENEPSNLTGTSDMNNSPTIETVEGLPTTNYDDLPTTTPNCLPNTLLNLLNVRKPTLFYLVDKVCTQNPILSSSYLKNNTPNTEVANQYKLVTYDILGGKNFWSEFAVK